MASFAICPLSNVPIRSNSTHKSELVSQLLFGELVEVLENKGRQWAKVRCHWDNFIGWVAANQLKPITPSEFQLFQEHYGYCLEVMHPVMADNHYLPITIGAQLPNFDGIHFKLGDMQYTFSGQAVFPADVENSTDFLIKIARRFLNAPYLWGGRSPFGIDADGLVQVVFKIIGVALPREASQQVYIGEEVDFVEQSRTGDIAFFENKAGKISHVGIILPENRIIHAFGRVRIDKVDHYGIYDEEQQRYTHQMRVVRRVFQPTGTSENQQEQTEQSSISTQVELF
jgi:hypothetical protein